ncbi:hypothetical protein AGMMS49982_19140 [Bacteroidia bacterium]|nr:hypothetical protein AGMMS49982_19140 [Bacteroidia bacterium]
MQEQKKGSTFAAENEKSIANYELQIANQVGDDNGGICHCGLDPQSPPLLCNLPATFPGPAFPKSHPIAGQGQREDTSRGGCYYLAEAVANIDETGCGVHRSLLD